MKTKTLILTSEFPPQPGGIGDHALNLAKGLQENGFEITLLCDNRSKKPLEEMNFDEHLAFQVVRIPRKRIAVFSYINRITTAFSLTKNMELIICSGKFSIWVGAFLSFIFKRKYTAIIHGSELRLPNIMLRKLTYLSLKRFHKIIAVSNYTKSLISHIELNNIEVIHNGFQMKFPDSAQEKNKPVPVLITVGNVTMRKGQHNVIKALPLLLKKYPDLKYHIVGIPTKKEEMQSLALELKVENSVFFLGKVSDTEKLELLQEADVFVMLSEKTKSGDVEGFGIAILEANALGVPAIGAVDCGIEDAIKPGVSGILINNKDSEQFAIALEDILKNYEVYSQGAKTWSKNFTWDKVIKEYLKVLKDS